MNKRLPIGLVIVLIGAVVVGVIYAASDGKDIAQEKLLSYDELMAAGRQIASGLGLVGEPIEEQGVMMPMGSWLTMDGALITSEHLATEGKTRTSPTFVYKVRGEIPHSILFPEDGRVEYFVLQIDAEAGDLRAFRAFGRGQAPYDLSRIPPDAGDPVLDDPGFEPELPPDIAERLGK